MNADELVARVARRASIPATDSRYAGLLGDVNDALHDFELRHPHGWDYTVRYLTFSTVADQAVYTFDELEAVLDENLVLTDELYPIRKIAEIDYTDTLGCRHPLERVPIRALHDLYPLTGCSPRYWHAEARKLTIGPTPSEIFDLELRVIIGEIDLVEGATPLAPAPYHQILVQLARALAYEAEQDDSAAAAARDRASQAVHQALVSERPMRGAGRTSEQG